MKKKCSICGEIKDISLFNKNKSKLDGYSYSCSSCQKEYAKKHYNNNKTIYLNKVKRNRLKKIEFFNRYKKLCKCSICGENRYWILDFHHKNPNEKDFSIGSFHREISIEKIKNEIRKCIVLCSNCHRDLHYKEKIGLLNI